MIKEAISYFKNNKEYWYGLVGVILISILAMSVFYNKSVVNYDGWYNLYAQDILDSRIPYKDFHFLMPPVFLYLWTFLQKVFGDYVIVSHTASLICKTALLGLLYHTFTRFFNKRISFISTILTLAVLLSVVFDNCTFSYNEFSCLISLIILNILITIIEKKERNGELSYKYLILLAIVNTLLFYTKQTHGMIVPFASIVILITIFYKDWRSKDWLKMISIYLSSFLLTTFVIFLPLLSKLTFASYVDNVYFSASAKGSITSILKIPIKLVASYTYIWPLIILGIIILVVCIVQKYTLLKFENGDINTNSKWLPNNIISIIACLLSIVVAYFLTAYLSQTIILNGLINTIALAYTQIGFICEFVIFFMALFYFLRFIINNDYLSAKKLVLFGIVFAIFFSLVLSNALPYTIYCMYGLVLATLLNYRTNFSKIIEVFVFILTISALCFSLISKMSLPIVFHGWQGINITAERKISKLKFLKGMKLSKIEVEAYEEIYDILNKYLKKEDKIFVFINNQLFYRLLDRTPFYNDHYTLYWDVCSESCASDIYNKFNTTDISKLPPAIIYLEYPESGILFHEYLFREGKMDNSQRKIDIQIKSNIKQGNYKIVETYDDRKYFSKMDNVKDYFKKLDINNKEYRSFMKNYNYEDITDVDKLNKISDYEKKQKILTKQIKKNLTDVNTRYFLANEYKLKILIRSDLYFREAK